MEKSWKNYLTELKRCRMEFSNEAVHDLRVATRRIMAIVHLLHSISPRSRLKKIIRTLKEQLDELDDLRDTQVILAEVSETIQELPELQTFQKQQQRIEEKLFRSLRKKVTKFDSHELSRRIHKTRDSIHIDTEDEMKPQVLRAIDDAYWVAAQRLERVDLSRPPTIHRVRIAFKTFRYMVEVMHPLLAGFPDANLKQMHEYQSLMGEVQDAEVFIQTLKEFSEHSPFSDPGPIHRYYEQRHADAIAAYAKNMNQLLVFWRLEPDQPFPWEKTK